MAKRSLATAFAALTLAVSALSCEVDDSELTVQQVEDLLDAAAACSFGDQCVVVDTYCCPRAINASYVGRVNDAMQRLEDGAEQACLADCVSADELSAQCVDGRCQLIP